MRLEAPNHEELARVDEGPSLGAGGGDGAVEGGPHDPEEERADHGEEIARVDRCVVRVVCVTTVRVELGAK